MAVPMLMVRCDEQLRHSATKESLRTLLKVSAEFLFELLDSLTKASRVVVKRTDHRDAEEMWSNPE